LLCTECNNTWKICCACNTFSKPMITKTQVNNHRHAYHNAKSKRKQSENVASGNKVRQKLENNKVKANHLVA
jgi:hypothetical protein